MQVGYNVVFSQVVLLLQEEKSLTRATMNGARIMHHRSSEKSGSSNVSYS
jgi:hypothetical protein